MIYLLLLLDILINNYTSYTSFLFLIYLYDKSYKHYLLTGLILDLIIFRKPYNIIILTIMYFINKIFKDLNKKNVLNYLLILVFNYIIYILLANILLSKITIILVKIGQNLIFNLILYLLGFNLTRKDYYDRI